MDDRNADEFFVLSLRWTRGESLTWWCPNNSGYTIVLEQAGRYSRSAVDGNPAYYNNGTTTLAIPCADVERVAVRVVPESSMLLKRLTGKVLATKYDEPGDECDACGNAPRQTVLGLSVVGEVPRGVASAAIEETRNG